MSTSINNDLVTALLSARMSGHKIQTQSFELDNVEQAYQIQQQVIERYVTEKQTKTTGWKIALSGQKAQTQYQLTEPVYGRLVADMQQNQPASIQVDTDESVKLEIELAFVLKQSLLPDQHYDDQQLIDAIAEIRPALEIVNIRWSQWNFNLSQFLADNAAAQGYVLGSPVAFNVSDLALDQVIASSSHELQKTSTAVDHPLKNYIWLVHKLLKEKQTLAAGEIILTGSLIRPLTVTTGLYEFSFLGQKLSLDVQKSQMN